MSLKHGILGLLLYRNMSGYELDKTFKESLNFFWTAHPSQIYRELAQMEKQALLTSELVFQTDKPNKKIYALTPSGKEYFHNWLSQSSETDSVLRHTFLVRMFFSGEQSTIETIATLKKYQQNCIHNLEKLSETAHIISNRAQLLDDPSKAIYWELTADFGESYFKMCLNWAENAIKQLEELS